MDANLRQVEKSRGIIIVAAIGLASLEEKQTNQQLAR